MGERSLLLDVGVRTVFHTVLVFGVFLLFAGHNAPGGGFIGGLVTAAAFVLRFVADPEGRSGRPLPFHPTTLLGGGIAIAVVTASASWLVGGELLESGKATLHPPLLGTVNVTSALPFDIGVYLVVVGLVLLLLRTLGAEAER